MGCRGRRFPQTVMRRHRAIVTAQRAQPPVEQREMHRFIRADPNPVIGETARKIAAEPSDHVEGEIDRDEFDMRQCMEQRDPPTFRTALAAPGHLVRRQQFGQGRPRRTIGHGDAELMRQQPASPCPRRRPGGTDLRRRVARFQHAPRRLRDARAGDQSSSFSASSTSITCPGTRTRRQMRTRTPFASNRKVDRSIPI